MKIFRISKILCLTLLLYLLPRTVKSDMLEFSDHCYASKFNRLAIDQSNGTVFISARNRLFKLSSNLDFMGTVKTFRSHEWKNYKQIMVVNQQNYELIICECIFEFVCEIYNRNDISRKPISVSEKNVLEWTNFGKKCDSVAFMNYHSRVTYPNMSLKMYFAVSYCRFMCEQPAMVIGTLDLNGNTKIGKIGAFDSDRFTIVYHEASRVNSVYGFDSGKFKYFLNNEESFYPWLSYDSKLIRICHDKRTLEKGYSQIPIRCELPNKETYSYIQAATIGKPDLGLARSLNISLDEDILFVVFSKMRYVKSIFKNALCVYSLNAINEKFTENIRNCFKGNGYRGFGSTSASRRCSESNENINSDFCSSVLNMPLHGEIPISASAVTTFDTKITAIATKPNKDEHNLYIGTNTGHLKTIMLQDGWHTCESADLVIDEGNPVNSDLLFSPQKDSLYVMTKDKLAKIELKLFNNCSNHTTYKSCVESGNRYCSWCRLTNACAGICDCRLKFKIVNVSSQNVSIGASEALQLYIPSPHSLYVTVHCLFFIANQFLFTYGQSFAKNSSSIVHCPILEADKIASLSKIGYFLNASIFIYSNYIRGYAEINIILFNCNSYVNRDACVSSMFQCQWHSKEQKCFYNGENITKDASIIYNGTFHKNVVSTNISNYIPPNSRNDFIQCQKWANSCYSCMNLDAKHNCAWCQSRNTCESRDNCGRPIKKKPNLCPSSPHPSISSFRPRSGSLVGGTYIIIRGKHLPYEFEDADSNQTITVAGVACTPLKNLYLAMKSITCVIKKSNPSPGQAGPVVLHLNGKTIKSEHNFKFVDLKLTKMFPKEGLIYGGTELTFQGENLDAGNSIKVFTDNSPCSVISRNATSVQCITASANMEKEAKVDVIIDKNVFSSPNDSFSSFKYVKDPLRDENGFNYDPKGIPAGGVTILIRNIFNVSTQQLLFLYIHHGDHNYNSTCKISHHSATIWSCLSPFMSDIDSGSIDAKYPKEMNITFSNSINIKPYFPSEHQSLKFLLFPNPEFYYFFNSTVEYEGNNYVIIAGKNIDKACQKPDIKVKVGNCTCEVISISSSRVICSLPKYLSYNVANDFDQEYDILADHNTILVTIGDKFTVIVPKQFNTVPEKPSTSIVYLVIIFIFVAISSITSILCISNHKIAAKTLQKLKKTQQQMTTLELRVALECKEAFAELQMLEITLKTDDLNPILPFLNYHFYMMNILFPNVNDHSIIPSEKAISIHQENRLQLFRELLTNRRFLLIFVRTLENEESFSMNDRVYVASMLMITLQKDMEYCTNILKTLMAELIEKYMRGKGHPKLLLRLTESIVEKMLSVWFSLLSYDFLKESAGSSLFNLFTAIKEHVNRGPVDMITSQARYCLCENKILRHKFEFFPMTVYVNISQQAAKILKLELSIEEVPVQVFDCDLISQFKEKAVDAIHRTINFSQKLNPSELNVEWVYDTSTRMILTDDDSSSLTDGEWKQMNTLKHYGVPNGSILNLISDHEKNYRTFATPSFFNLEKSQNNVKNLQTSSFHKIRRKSMTESTTAMIQGTDDVSYKKWHLIKPSSPQYDQEGCNGSDQIIPEIFLTRLLATKSSLQKFVDELFNVIFKKPNQNSSFPIAVKYMFDFLDDQARQYNIIDPEVVHVWKNNCLPLRFWVNLIKNPNFLFDVRKSNIVDSCLSVIAQVFMDSCSTSEQLLSKDSATTKLLYAKEISIYNKLVKKYYAHIKNMRKISSQDMNTILADMSNKYAADFDTIMSVNELLKYATKYKEKLIDALKNDEFSNDSLLVSKFEKMMEIFCFES